MCDDCHSLSRMMTTRQHEVFACLTMGDTDAEIAERLECAPATVRRQVARILEVAGATGREELLCPEVQGRRTTSPAPPTGDPSDAGEGGGRKHGSSVPSRQSV